MASMDSALARFMLRMPLSTQPQEAFEQADDLLQQAAALREHADDLRDQADFMSERADTLTVTAEGLQEVGVQDRDAMQTMFERGLVVHKDMFNVYVSDPKKAVCFDEMKKRVEDGMVTLGKMEMFLDDVHNYFFNRERVPRSTAPETEMLAKHGPTIELPSPSILAPEPISNQTLKRKLSASHEGGEAVLGVCAKETKRMRQCQESDEDTVVHDEHHGFLSVVSTERLQNHVKGRTEAEESSDEDSESTDNEGSGLEEHQADCDLAHSSDEDDKSSVSTKSHTTDEASEPASSSSSTHEHSDDDESESDQSSASTSTSPFSLGAATIYRNHAMRRKSRLEKLSETVNKGGNPKHAADVGRLSGRAKRKC